MNWNEYDKKVDTEALQKDIEMAADGEGEFKEVPVGNYEVEVEKLELKMSKTNKPMVFAQFKIVNNSKGFNGSRIFMNQVVQQGFGLHVANEFLKSLKAGDVEFKNYAQYDGLLENLLTTIENKKYSYHLEYGKNDKGFNTYKIKEVFEN